MIDRIGSLFADVDSLAALGTDVAVKATLICLIALAADRLLGRRVLARSAAWHACLLGLVSLPLATICFPQWRVACLPRDAANSVAPGLVPGGSVTAPGISNRHADPNGHVDQPPPAVSAMPSLSAMDQPTDWARAGITAAVITYVAGVCLLLVRLCGSWRCARRLVQAATTMNDADWIQALDELRQQLGLVRQVELRSSAAVGVPLFVGWWRPAILLPEGLAQSATAQARRAVLLHELAHARRGDYTWNLLLRLTQAIYWPHPLIWLSGRGLARVREEACDCLCVYWLGDATVYRETLVELAAGLLRRPAASLGMAITRTTRLERRLAQLERGRALPRCLLSWPLRTGLATAVVLAAGALAMLHLDRSSAAADPAIANTEAKPQRPANSASTAVSEPAALAADDAAIPAETKQPEQGERAGKPGDVIQGPVRVRVAKVRREDFVLKSVQMCSVVASRTARLHARVSGIITRRNVELGDRVKKGDVLAEIDAPEVAEDVLIAQADADEAAAAQSQAEAGVKVAQATIAEARAAIVQRQAEIAASTAKIAQRKSSLTYSMRMREKGFVTEADVENKEEAVKAAEADERSMKSSMTAAEANVSRAQAQYEATKAAVRVARLRAEAARRHLERIRQHTDYLQIRAPIDGAITEVGANVGSLTSAGSGEPLFMVSSMDPLTAIVELPQQDALRVKRGDTAAVRFDALAGRTFKATVSRMAYAFSPKNQTLRTEIDLNNPEGLLRPGMNGAAAIHLETHPNVLTIPRDALSATGKEVFRVVDGRARSTAVRVASDRAGVFEVLEGLGEGDVVIISARVGENFGNMSGIAFINSGLADGVPVEIEQDDDE